MRVVFLLVALLIGCGKDTSSDPAAGEKPATVYEIEVTGTGSIYASYLTSNNGSASSGQLQDSLPQTFNTSVVDGKKGLVFVSGFPKDEGGSLTLTCKRNGEVVETVSATTKLFITSLYCPSP